MECESFDFDPSSPTYEGNDSKWLQVGVHDVIVTDHEFGFAGTGSKYLELTFTDGGGATHKERFSLVDTALWKLATLFKAIGHTAKLDLESPGAIKKVVYGKPIRVTIALGKANKTTGKQYKQVARIDAAEDIGV